MKLAAVATLVLVGLAVGQTIRPIPTTQVRLVGEIPAEWWTYVHLETNSDGSIFSAYIVPADRHFVVTAVYRQGTVRVDGVESSALSRFPSSVTAANGTRIVFPPGVTLESYGGGAGSLADLWGYLEPVR